MRLREQLYFIGVPETFKRHPAAQVCEIFIYFYLLMNSFRVLVPTPAIR